MAVNGTVSHSLLFAWKKDYRWQCLVQLLLLCTGFASLLKKAEMGLVGSGEKEGKKSRQHFYSKIYCLHVMEK